MKVVIIQDKFRCAKILKDTLMEADKTIEVGAILNSASEVRNYFSDPGKKIDLIFMDTQLKNESSQDLLKTLRIPAPIVFVTAYDNLLPTVAEEATINYVLKPVNIEKINSSLNKFRVLRDLFNKHVPERQKQGPIPHKKYRARVLLRKGIEFLYIKTEDIAYLYMEQTLIFIVDFNNNRFISEYKTMAEIEEDFDPFLFFRASRRFVLNIKSIKKFKPIDRVKLTVELVVPVPEEIIVSQDNATRFKNWVANRDMQ